MQYKAHNDCYRKSKHIYDWFVFYDMDEFIHLTNINNIKKYLSNDCFNNCNVIHLNQVLHTDNGQIYYYNKSLFERFPNYTLNFDKKMGLTKMIIKGNLPNIHIINPHIIQNNYQCNSIGKIINISDKNNTNNLYNKYFYYDHFHFKSSEEYYNKLIRGDAVFGKRDFNEGIFFFYFSINKITDDKLNYFQNRTGLNLDIYRNSTLK